MTMRIATGFAATALAAVLAAAAPAAAEEVGVTKDTIKIGGIGAMTGPLSNLLIPQLNGVQAVFEAADLAHADQVERRVGASAATTAPFDELPDQIGRGR